MEKLGLLTSPEIIEPIGANKNHLKKFKIVKINNRRLHAAADRLPSRNFKFYRLNEWKASNNEIKAESAQH
jgi:hypothetical protein